MARMASDGVIGRIETTSGPEKRPAGRQATAVRYIGTFTPCSMCRTGSPAASNARSKVNEHPIRNATRSARHDTDATSSTTSPSRWIR